MPGVDGYALIAALRGNPRTRATPVVALTGFGRASDVRRAAEAGFDAHLRKPVTLERLSRHAAARAAQPRPPRRPCRPTRRRRQRCGTPRRPARAGAPRRRRSGGGRGLRRLRAPAQRSTPCSTRATRSGLIQTSTKSLAASRSGGAWPVTAIAGVAASAGRLRSRVEQLDAVEVGQAEVEQQQRRRLGLGAPQRARAVAGDDQPVRRQVREHALHDLDVEGMSST